MKISQQVQDLLNSCQKVKKVQLGGWPARFGTDGAPLRWAFLGRRSPNGPDERGLQLSQSTRHKQSRGRCCTVGKVRLRVSAGLHLRHGGTIRRRRRVAPPQAVQCMVVHGIGRLYVHAGIVFTRCGSFGFVCGGHVAADASAHSPELRGGGSCRGRCRWTLFFFLQGPRSSQGWLAIGIPYRLSPMVESVRLPPLDTRRLSFHAATTLSRGERPGGSEHHLPHSAAKSRG